MSERCSVVVVIIDVPDCYLDGELPFTKAQEAAEEEARAKGAVMVGSVVEVERSRFARQHDQVLALEGRWFLRFEGLASGPPPAPP